MLTSADGGRGTSHKAHETKRLSLCYELVPSAFSMMFRFLSAVAADDQPRLIALDERLRDFYRTADEQNYWELADGHNVDWRDGGHPQHERLLEWIGERDRVADFGC